MKKYLYLAVIALACSGALVSSCNDDKLTGDSIFTTKEQKRNPFDQWLYKNYTMPYNVDFQYRLKTEETDKSYNFVPADSAKAAKLAIITKFMWFDPYAQIVGLDFIKENAPRIIITVGIPGYTRHNSEVLGSAEGGYKVTLTKVNALTADVLKDYSSMTTFYFHTMHHEFMHILNQKKPYDESYDNISRADYLSGNWTSWSDRQAQKQGFVSAYSMENPAEDFAEMYAKYVTRTPQEWNDILTVAGTKGKSIINRKLKMVRDYMKTAWDADIDLLRNDILRRGGKIETLNLESLE